MDQDIYDMRRDVQNVIAERPKTNLTWISKTPRHQHPVLDVEGEQLDGQANRIRQKRQKMAEASL